MQPRSVCQVNIYRLLYVIWYCHDASAIIPAHGKLSGRSVSHGQLLLNPRRRIPDADSKDIRQAFRKKARSYHPDLNPGSEEAEARFKEINEAYEVLSDPDSRRKYDAYGDQWKQADQIEAQRRAASRSPFGFGGARRSRTAYEGDIFGGLEDIFGHHGRIPIMRADIRNDPY